MGESYIWLSEEGGIFENEFGRDSGGADVDYAGRKPVCSWGCGEAGWMLIGLQEVSQDLASSMVDGDPVLSPNFSDSFSVGDTGFAKSVLYE